MAFIRGRDNETGAIREDLTEEWVERWPEDYTVLDDDGEPVALNESAAADAEDKEQADGR